MATAKSKKINARKKTARQKKMAKTSNARALFDNIVVRMGDDGLPMTKPRIRLHRVLNVFFIWAVICLLYAAGLLVFSYFQGQDYTFYELIAYGGNTINGHSAATLIRIDGLFALALAALSIMLNMYGFGWFYDNDSFKKTRILLTIAAIVSIVVCCASIVLIHAPEPLAILTLILLGLFWKFANDVVDERLLAAN